MDTYIYRCHGYQSAKVHHTKRLAYAAMLSQSKYLAGLCIEFLGKKPQSFIIPICICNTTILYDKQGIE